MPAARVGDQAACIGPPDAIATGEPTVLIGGKPAARLGDTTVHGGVIVTGCATVFIGTEPIDPTVREARRHIGSRAWDFEANRLPLILLKLINATSLSMKCSTIRASRSQ